MTKLHIQPPIIAHRGACGYAPENTLASFTKAAQMGFSWVEFDVMLTACDTPVVFHDETLARTTNDHGSVGDYSYAYLQSLDAGAWFNPKFSGERIPLLTQVLDFLQLTHMSANIEIKPLPGQDKKTTVRVWEEISRNYSHCLPNILFSSFSIDALTILRELSPDCMMGLLMDEWRPDWQLICEDLNCVSVHVSNDILTQDMTTKIKHTNRQVLCYTVNTPTRAKQLFSWGVDAIFSDVPDRVMTAIVA